jgi:hypothetical protein
LIIGILGLLFAVGTGCLAYLAIGNPGTSTVGSGTEASPGAEGTEASGIATADGTPPDGSSGGGDTAPPKPGRSINVNGVDLDGDGGIDCVVVINSFAEVDAKVTSVQLISEEAAIVADPSGCQTQEGPGCAGAVLDAGDDGRCTVGARLTGDEASGPYPVTVRLGLRATCTSARPVPCNQVAGRSPTAANPITITWTGSLNTTVDVTGPDVVDSPLPEGETPDPQESPDTEESPETQATPESPASESSP